MAFSRFLRKSKHAPDDRLKNQEPNYQVPVHDESNWLVSYADLMTLLCGFFIILFSLSKLDQPQYEKVKESIATQFGGKYESPTADTAKFLTRVLQEAGVTEEATLKSDAYGVSIIFRSTVFFETLSSDIKTQGQMILDRLIAGISTRENAENKKYRVVIEGHTDGRPIISGVYPSNWELSSARAAKVIRLFLAHGFSPDRLTAIGYADTHPVLPERTPAGTLDEKALSQNRRVVIRVLEPKTEAIPFPDTAPAPSDPASTAH